uniref:Uncharacterized protein n=1 Tax=Chromera velia CCMP2878 TaxID=1169474 RepID=A0A0G4FCF9_9ALVE|eukprot:Cvel_16346.t1-p1 / transcript=Cvel_16346.t1 / gene=Cvel_16346 / organism=Chromera_velia_CCMP2878 / gene_product=hypothetical protein / transcript_product=hypothetical protein / location=Cvel_scaffold1255:2517-4898(+) / protein_length=558 / sequence_SO=supercontig / SO=protein_coding / is_pseudo=false
MRIKTLAPAPFLLLFGRGLTIRYYPPKYTMRSGSDGTSLSPTISPGGGDDDMFFPTMPPSGPPSVSEPVPLTAEEKEMFDLIDNVFEGIYGGELLERNLVKLDSYEICPKLIKNGEASGSGLRELLGDVGFLELCGGTDVPDNEKDMLCRAVFATEEAFIKLAEKFPKGPKFAKWFMVRWGPHASAEFPIPSCVRSSYKNVHLDSIPPSAELIDGNGCNAYAVCDILVTILAQSNNQADVGSCGPTATLAAVEDVNPALAMKMAVSLVWTGYQTRTHYGSNCGEGVYDLFPGLIPRDDTEAVNHLILDNIQKVFPSVPIDLPAILAWLKEPRPRQVPFAHAWVTSLMVQVHTMGESFSMLQQCPEEGPMYQGVLVAKWSTEEETAINKQLFGSGWQQQMAMCDLLAGSVGWTCSIAYINKESKVHDGRKGDPPPQEFVDGLEEACENGGALMRVNAGLLQGASALQARGPGALGSSVDVPIVSWNPQNPDANMYSNHVTYLSGCVGDVVVVWSWARRFYFHKDLILGDHGQLGMTVSLFVWKDKEGGKGDPTLVQAAQ